MKTLNKIINEELNKIINKLQINPVEIKFNDVLMSNLFDDTLSEKKECDENKTKEVLSLINNNEFDTNVPPQVYENMLTNNPHTKMLTPYTANDLNSMKLFKLKNYNIGFALKKSDIDNKYSEIVAVVNNEPDVCGIGNALIQSAVKNGGCHLDHFDGFLSSLYERNGFVETNRYKFDPQYDENGEFEKIYGRADVIFRTHKNCL